MVSVVGQKMSRYLVAYEVIYSEVVEAESPEEAAEIVYNNCPYDVDGEACVTDIATDEEWRIG